MTNKPRSPFPIIVLVGTILTVYTIKSAATVRNWLAARQPPRWAATELTAAIFALAFYTVVAIFTVFASTIVAIVLSQPANPDETARSQ